MVKLSTAKLRGGMVKRGSAVVQPSLVMQRYSAVRHW